MLNIDIDPPPGAMRGLQVIFLNGPPRAGKDSAGNAICNAYPGEANIAKFAGPLKRMTHAQYNMPEGLPAEYFEDVKDLPRQEFYGKTPRQAYIFTSENIIKPNFGQDFFGLLMLRTLWREYQAGRRLIAVTDSGFAPEALPVVNAVGESHCILLRVHGEARGKTFNGDSRSFIELPGVETYDIYNDVEGDRAKFETDVLRAISGWRK